MNVIYLLLLVVGGVFFALEAFYASRPPRFNFLASGLLCWILVDLIRTAHHL